jgi:uncharacterized membrane protein YhfC
VSQDVLIGLAISSASATLLPIIIFILFRKSFQLSGLAVAAGAAVFILMVVVLEATMHNYILVANPVTKALFDTQPWLFAIYGAGAAALFEESGRYAAMRILASRGARPSTPLAYAIGHGGAESILIGINAGVIAVIGYMIVHGQAQSLHLDAATQAKITDMLKGATLQTGLLGGIERMSAFAIQLGLSYLMWSAVTHWGWPPSRHTSPSTSPPPSSRRSCCPFRARISRSPMSCWPCSFSPRSGPSRRVPTKPQHNNLQGN